jgi:transposase-like protein
LAERGIMVSYETVRALGDHFGPMIAADLRKRAAKGGTRSRQVWSREASESEPLMTLRSTWPD